VWIEFDILADEIMVCTFTKPIETGRIFVKDWDLPESAVVAA